ncbi:MAG: T9SS type A sorting domain-containing protein [Calditrichaeota bacterium]|nr:T9SS type A sorting domain-containing protein [Calditrichota bacterium]
MRRGFFVLTLAALFSTSEAAIRLVAEGESIQAAVNLSTAGDTVILGTGTHAETVVVHGTRIAFGSQYLLTGDTAAIRETQWEPDDALQDTHSVLVLMNIPEPGYLVSGISFSCGSGTIWTTPDGPYDTGGGIFAFHSEGRLRACRFEGGQTQIGGGIALVGDRFARRKVSVEGCEFRRTIADYWGGGLYNHQDSIRVTECSFDSCFRDAISFISGYSVMESCTVRYTGGGVGAVEGGLEGGSIQDCLFENNGTWLNETGGVGHLIVNGGGSIVGCTFRGDIGNVYGLLIENLYSPGISFRNNIIEGHDADSISGNLLADDFDNEIAYNIFRDNHATGGGALFLLGHTDGRIHHNVFSNNSAPGNPAFWGSAIVSVCSRYRSLRIDNNLIVGNQGMAATFIANPPNVDRIHVENNWWGDASGPYHPTLNPEGQGDTLYGDHVFFDPWLTSPPDTSSSAVQERPIHPNVSTWELLEVFPNPFNNTFTLHIAGFTGAGFRLRLVNLLGREVAELYEGRIDYGELRIAAPPKLASGVYFLVASDDRKLEAKKIVFMK